MCSGIEHLYENSPESKSESFIWFESSSFEFFQQELETGLYHYYSQYYISEIPTWSAEKLLWDLKARISTQYNNYEVDDVKPEHFAGFSILSGLLVVQDTWGVEYTYDFNIDGKLRFLWYAPHDILCERRDVIREQTEGLETVLNAMDEVFQKNEREWFDRLGENDIYSWDLKVQSIEGESLKLQWKNIIELYNLAREHLLALRLARSSIQWWDPVDIKMYHVEKRFADMALGIWDVYEGWAKLFDLSPDELNYLVSRQIESFVDNDDLLSFLSSQHEKMYRNTHRSESVNTANTIYSQAIHNAIYQRFTKQLEISETNGDIQNHEKIQSSFLRLIKIITGREWNVLKILHNPDLAAHISSYLLTRPWGIIERLNEHNNTDILQEDPEMNGRTPNQTIDRFISVCQKRLFEWETKKSVKIFIAVKYGIPMKLLSWANDLWDYWELSFQEKWYVSLMERMADRLSTQKKLWYTYSFEKFDALLRDISQETQNDLRKYLSREFDSKFFDWNGFWSDDLLNISWESGQPLFSQADGELLDLFNDIEWNGLFDFSDVTNSYIYEWTKIAIIIWAAVVLFVATWWTWAALVWWSIIAQWAVVWAWATMASWATHPLWHDTHLEMLTDLWSDLAIWTALWAWWWALGKLAIGWAGITSVNGFKTAARNFSFIQAPDLTSGIAIEMFARYPTISRIFHAWEIITWNDEFELTDIEKLPDFS